MALAIFAERLPLVKTDVRAISAPAIAAILRLASGLLVTPSSTVSAALAAIRVVASSAINPEDAALAETLPKLVDAIGHISDAGNLTATLSLMELTL